mmetsp:Transcript_9866/g.25594  ORF Transcript_9866/g.25594 Transcript_9866/m.25594 type:complete len:243 (-) Transcript_9866:422-1150(-)
MLALRQEGLEGDVLPSICHPRVVQVGAGVGRRQAREAVGLAANAVVVPAAARERAVGVPPYDEHVVSNQHRRVPPPLDGRRLAKHAIVPHPLPFAHHPPPLAVQDGPPVVHNVVIPVVGAKVGAVWREAPVDGHDVDVPDAVGALDPVDNSRVARAPCRAGGHDATPEDGARLLLLLVKGNPVDKILLNPLLLPLAVGANGVVNRNPKGIVGALVDGDWLALVDAVEPDVVQELVVAVDPPE